MPLYTGQVDAETSDGLREALRGYGRAVREMGMERDHLRLLATGDRSASIRPLSLDSARELLAGMEEIRIDPRLRYSHPDNGTAAVFERQPLPEGYRIAVGGEDPDATAAVRDTMSRQTGVRMTRPDAVDRVVTGVGAAYNRVRERYLG